MIVHLLRLTLWEWFKVRKRWMPWILLAVAIAIPQTFLWTQVYTYNDRLSVDERSMFFLQGPLDAQGNPTAIPITCADIREDTVDDKLARSDEASREESLRTVAFMRDVSCPELQSEEASFLDETRWGFVLPDSISNGLGVAHGIGVVLMVILAASVLGTEYGWGTLRSALTRGVGRWQFLAAKALSLLFLSAGGLIFVALTLVVSSLIASLFADDGGGLVDAGQWSTVAVMFGKALYGLAPYALLALFLSVLTSSSSMGIAIGVAYYVAEGILVITLTALLDAFDTVSNYVLGPSVTAWMVQAGVQTTGADQALFPAGDLPGTLHAFLVLLAYILVLAAATFWLFQRRDVSGAKGE